MKIPKSLYLVVCHNKYLREVYWNSIAETRSESIRKYVSTDIGTINPKSYWKHMAKKCGLECIKFEKVKRAVK